MGGPAVNPPHVSHKSTKNYMPLDHIKFGRVKVHGKASSILPARPVVSGAHGPVILTSGDSGLVAGRATPNGSVSTAVNVRGPKDGERKGPAKLCNAVSAGNSATTTVSATSGAMNATQFAFCVGRILWFVWVLFGGAKATFPPLYNVCYVVSLHWTLG